ncbi:MAG TPA: DUF3037 domain-containing protein [Roseiflexaceae bacterium]|nr:DUF3037 domain-containing protein [Roseiflexaceae bacterium]HMP40452.1 DUF3037 domain-containing protein [Roseiflexaceae bacterium]
MPVRSAYEYSVIRLVPRVERGEAINVAVVLFCRAQRFLDARIQFVPERALTLDASLDVAAVAEQLERIPLICRGGAAAGPIGELPPQERFRWLAAPRSTIIQPSAIHSGLCNDPAAVLEHLADRLL